MNEDLQQDYEEACQDLESTIEDLAKLHALIYEDTELDGNSINHVNDLASVITNAIKSTWGDSYTSLRNK